MTEVRVRIVTKAMAELELMYPRKGGGSHDPNRIRTTHVRTDRGGGYLASHLGGKMTTREEYAEAAKWIGLQVALPGEEKPALLAARVLRQLAEGAVLCKVVSGQGIRYEPLEQL